MLGAKILRVLLISCLALCGPPVVVSCPYMLRPVVEYIRARKKDYIVGDPQRRTKRVSRGTSLTEMSSIYDCSIVKI